MASQSDLLFHRLLRDFGRPAPTDLARRQLLDSLVQRKLLTTGTSVLVLLAPPEFIAELAARGVSVTAVEPLEELLEQARRRLTGTTATVHWVRRDPHRLPFRRAFDLILSMGLVLGTSGNEAEDQEFLRSLAAALRPGGTLVLELPNRELLVREFVERFWADLDGLRVLVLQDWDVPTGTVRLDWHFVWPHGTVETRHVALRLYCAAELAARCRDAGLTMLEWWGDDNATPYGLWAPRLLLVARLGGEPTEPLVVGGERG